MKKNDIGFRLGELFCGPGGIARATKDLVVENEESYFSLRHVWATDYHEDTCATYRRNIFPDLKVPVGSPEDPVLCADIRDPKTLDKLAWKSGIDTLAFGFPCNDFSMVGEQRGTDGVFGPLYTYAATALERFQPRWFLAENVGGLKSANDGKAFASILKAFSSKGYVLYPHLYKFEEYGVPQARHRIIIIGIKDDQNIEFRVPAPTFVTKTAREALSAIPTWATHQERTKQSERVIQRLQHIRPGENAFTANLPDHLRLNVRGARISQIYKRLDPDRPAYTVTGSGGGGTHIYHWAEPRALTNRERATLQTFPYDYQFVGSKESIRRQIGMAVPVDGARIIFEAVLKCFAHIDYISVPTNIDVVASTRFDPHAIDQQLKKVAEHAVVRGREVE